MCSVQSSSSESYDDMRSRHELELAGWVQEALRNAASVSSAARAAGVNSGTMSRLVRRLGEAKSLPPHSGETYDELRDRHEREVLSWMRSSLSRYGSLKQVGIHCSVNHGTLSRILWRLRRAES